MTEPRTRQEGHNPCPKCGREMDYVQKAAYLKCPKCGHLESRKKTRKWMEKAREGT